MTDEDMLQAFTFEKTFRNTGEDFSAEYAAEKWLNELGFRVGSSAAGAPRGIKQGMVSCYVRTGDGKTRYDPNGVHPIEKWHNLSDEDRAGLDGVLLSDDARNGDATVRLRRAPT